MRTVPGSATIASPSSARYSRGRALLRPAGWISRHELLLLAIAMALLFTAATWSILGLLIILAIWLGRWLTLGRLTQPTPLDVPLLILFFMALIGFAVAADPHRAYRRLLWLSAQIALTYSLINCLRSRRDIRRFAQGLVVGTIAFALVTLIGADWPAAPLIDVPWLYDHIPTLIVGFPSGGLAPHPVQLSPRTAGNVLAIPLPLSLIMVFHGTTRWSRLLALVALLAGGLVLLLTQAVMGLIGFASAVLLIAIWWRRWLLWPVIASSLLVAGTALAYGPWRWLLLRMLDVNNDFGIRVLLRFDMWSRASAMIRDMPFTGIGLDNFEAVQTHFYVGHLLGPEQNAHNLLLQTILDLGVAGAVTLVWLLLATVIMVVYAYRVTNCREIKALLVAFGAGVLAYVAGGATSAVPIGEIYTTIMWAVLGLAAATTVVARKGSPGFNPSWNLPSGGWLLAVPVLAIILSLLLFPSALQRNLSLIPAQQAIYEARNTGRLPIQKAELAVSRLDRATGSNPDDPELFGLLGSLHAWQGDEQSALDALRQRVALDLHDPLGRYAPFLKWRLQLAGEPIPSPAEGLLRVYRPWRDRYPDRAESYVLTALVWQHLDNKAQAAHYLQVGLDNNAVPRELLQAYVSLLESGD